MLDESSTILDDEFDNTSIVIIKSVTINMLQLCLVCHFQ